jgi:hypothetical protein
MIAEAFLVIATLLDFVLVYVMIGFSKQREKGYYRAPPAAPTPPLSGEEGEELFSEATSSEEGGGLEGLLGGEGEVAGLESLTVEEGEGGLETLDGEREEVEEPLEEEKKKPPPVKLEEEPSDFDTRLARSALPIAKLAGKTGVQYIPPPLKKEEPIEEEKMVKRERKEKKEPLKKEKEKEDLEEVKEAEGEEMESIDDIEEEVESREPIEPPDLSELRISEFVGEKLGDKEATIQRYESYVDRIREFLRSGGDDLVAYKKLKEKDLDRGTIRMIINEAKSRVKKDRQERLKETEKNLEKLIEKAKYEFYKRRISEDELRKRVEGYENRLKSVRAKMGKKKD